MTRYVLGRFAGIIGVLFIVSIMIFLMIHTIPGGPFDAMPTTSEFRDIPEHIREKLMAKYGLDKPLYVQYFRYMWAALRGDFGISFRYGEPVTDFISRSWPATAQLGLSAMAIGIPIGIGLGILAALRPNTWLDYLTNVVVITTFVTPVFVIAIMSIIIFAVILKWLPSGGWGEPKQWILPTFVYAVGQIGGMARFTRASMVDAMQAEYVRTARAKGLRESAVVMRHAFRSASLPLVTLLGPMVVNLLLGSFFIEAIFRIPGIGGQITLALYNRDYPVIMALILLWTFAIAIAYLVTDLLYGVVDPRIRVGGTM
ncbi:MAG: ABC transporter permease [Caldilineaceae bacterium]|nr:ABC transporter permease [Caldilineaceae bacterium]MDE0461068.1 ABC transporter permease [Caldilineaceae bacterium]MDE0464898.1 ABC transporter permease [Caldilineaceae bacterium]MXX27982.1 ABC transporter permease [Caldilineaceae bacterium SB0668_bin_21]MYC21716.1 ABC transporter permease [Caldilineaceae bacterium SB0662_bin_25]